MRAAILIVAVLVLTACSSTRPTPSTEATPPGSPMPPRSTGTPSGLLPASRSQTPGPSTATLARACPVTAPNGRTPPGETADPLYLGDGHLFTVLWPHGIVFVPAGNIDVDGYLGMKFPWWRGPGVRGALQISGHEVDLGLDIRSGVPDGYGKTGFQASGIGFPVEGCYEVTGEAGDARLTFVTMVRKCAALAELPSAEQETYSICDP